MSDERPILTLAHSPDADDLVMWWPLVGMTDGQGRALDGPEGRPAIDTGRFRFRCIASDVQELNRTGRRDEIKAIDRARCLTGNRNDEYVEDASFFKLRNVTLSWSIPEFLLGPVSSGTLSISGQNLWVSTDYTGTDPEVHEGGAENDSREDYYSMPPRRALVTRLSITF